MTTRPATMRDVAARAGVSRQLVSLVLGGKPGPSDASRSLVLKAAAELDFRPNLSAQLLRQDRTGLIGVLFEAHNPFEARFVERLLERAPSAGFGVILGPATPKRDTETVVGEMLAHRVEAMACFNPVPESPALQRALADMPVVWLGERPGDPRADAVHADDEMGLTLVVAHLVGLGHRRIAYAGGSGGRVGPDRAAAYRSVMTAAGLGDEIDVVLGGFAEEDGAAAARTLLGRPELPTAVIGSSDACAAGMLAVFARAGVRVPEDVSVTGYDDSDLAALSYNDMTAVRQDIEASVDATLDAVVRRLADRSAPARETATATTLTVRSTTAPPRS